MPISRQFNHVLRQWSEVFMGRSMRDFSAFMRASGLSMPQISALYRLYYQGPCGVSDIAEHLAVSSAAASQMIERLVQQDLLQRSEDPSDRRAKQIALSPAGRALMEESIEARVRWMAELTTVLSPEEQTTIIAALDALTSAAIHLDPHSQAREVEQ
jgi:DNA-binding MarR family transcriptional regulator